MDLGSVQDAIWAAHAGQRIFVAELPICAQALSWHALSKVSKKKHAVHNDRVYTKRNKNNKTKHPSQPKNIILLLK